MTAPTPAPMSVGIACYPTFGGSGIIATEIGREMAVRGHRVHLFSYETPGRFAPHDAMFFHEVEVRDYPLFKHAPYALALTSKIASVAQWERLDILHAHYAVPHATSAVLARQILGDRAPKIVTTLHGTDITLVGTDPSYLPITRYSIASSDAVTVPSAHLRDVTRSRLDLPDLPIEVIPNFVDTDAFAPPAAPDPARVSHLFDVALGPAADPLPPGTPTLVHVSNFRPLKRIDLLVEIFARVNEALPCRLMLVGDGPERAPAEARLRALGLSGRTCFLGKQQAFVDVLRHADVFVLPSETESFGVAALEAMSCGVPVVASDVGGLPEVVAHGETGLLTPVGDGAAMAEAIIGLLTAPARRHAMGIQARKRATERFALGPLVDRYEALYRRVAAL